MTKPLYYISEVSVFFTFFHHLLLLTYHSYSTRSERCASIRIWSLLYILSIILLQCGTAFCWHIQFPGVPTRGFVSYSASDSGCMLCSFLFGCLVTVVKAVFYLLILNRVYCSFQNSALEIPKTRYIAMNVIIALCIVSTGVFFTFTAKGEWVPSDKHVTHCILTLDMVALASSVLVEVASSWFVFYLFSKRLLLVWENTSCEVTSSRFLELLKFIGGFTGIALVFTTTVYIFGFFFPKYFGLFFNIDAIVSTYCVVLVFTHYKAVRNRFCTCVLGCVRVWCLKVFTCYHKPKENREMNVEINVYPETEITKDDTMSTVKREIE